MIAVALVHPDTGHAAGYLHSRRLGYTDLGRPRCETTAILGAWQPAYAMLTHAATYLPLPDDVGMDRAHYGVHVEARRHDGPGQTPAQGDGAAPRRPGAGRRGRDPRPEERAAVRDREGKAGAADDSRQGVRARRGDGCQTDLWHLRPTLLLRAPDLPGQLPGVPRRHACRPRRLPRSPGRTPAGRVNASRSGPVLATVLQWPPKHDNRGRRRCLLGKPRVAIPRRRRPCGEERACRGRWRCCLGRRRGGPRGSRRGGWSFPPCGRCPC